MIKIIHNIGASENFVLKLIANLLRRPISIAQFKLLKIYKDKSAIDLVRTIKKDGDSLMWPDELIQIYHCVSSVKKLAGDFAEVGVYSGRSAKLICEIKGDRTIHLFDTYKGLPNITSEDSGTMKEKMYSANLDSVKKYLGNYKNVIFHSGLFPKTAEPVKDKLFAFVHLDADLYRSTLECLKFFYPRMTFGGIIMSHDYSNLTGVKKAFDEFFINKNENVIELSTSQCIIIKNSPSLLCENCESAIQR